MCWAPCMVVYYHDLTQFSQSLSKFLPYYTDKETKMEVFYLPKMQMAEWGILTQI